MTEKRTLVSALASFLDVPASAISARAGSDDAVDFITSAAGERFAIRVITNTAAGPVATQAAQLIGATKTLRPHAVPLLAAPYMTEPGRQACRAAGASWFDFSGNGHVVASRLRVIIDGRPNQFRRVTRPSNVFAPKSARVVRWLLMNHAASFTQRELARATSLTEGFVSRIVTTLETDGYVLRGAATEHRGKGAVRLRDASALLEDWRAAYQFDRHEILRGHVSARSGDALSRFISDTFTEARVNHAATGLAAAWQLTHFASFRVTSYFTAERPSDELLERLGFHDDPRGANLWLVVPNDTGVFDGATTIDGIRCVHPVQAYVDLEDHPERAREAAEHLRSTVLNWEPHG